MPSKAAAAVTLRRPRSSPSATGARRRRSPSDGSDASDRAYRRIRTAIAEQTFEPGQHLQEATLASWLGLSRTPVREALRRLERDGLVARSGARGVVVAQVTIADIERAYLLLEVLEGLAARMAAQQLTDKDALTLQKLVVELRQAQAQNNLERWALIDASLHDLIRTIAGYPKLSELVGLVYPVIDRVRNTYLLDGSEPERRASLMSDHVAMGEAVLERDPERAEAIARRLFAEGGRANGALLRRWISPLRRSF
jgi:DNA-binding GntR family transcriptional regulator